MKTTLHEQPYANDKRPFTVVLKSYSSLIMYIYFCCIKIK